MGIKARIALVGSFVAGVFIFALVYNCPLTLLRLLRCPDEALQEAEGYLKARALVAPVQVPSLPFPLERGGAGARSLLPWSTACPRLVSVPSVPPAVQCSHDAINQSSISLECNLRFLTRTMCSVCIACVQLNI